MQSAADQDQIVITSDPNDMRLTGGDQVITVVGV